MFVILNECEEPRIACGAVPARDPSAATLCQDDTIVEDLNIEQLLYHSLLLLLISTQQLLQMLATEAMLRRYGLLA